MDFRVRRVAELLQQQVFFRIAGDDLFRFLDCALHAFRTFGQHQIGAQRFQQLTAFNTHGFRHGQRQFVTASGGDVGQSDTRITAGGFNQFNARLKNATFFGIPNHIGTDTAFDAEARVT